MPMPRGMPTTARMQLSKITFLLICPGVVPTDASIPYSLVFSVMEIEILLRIMKMLDIIIMNIIRPVNPNTILIVLSEILIPLNLRSSLFIPKPDMPKLFEPFIVCSA